MRALPHSWPRLRVMILTRASPSARFLCTMEWKATKLYSILNFKCPHCHEGAFYAGRHLYDLKHIGDVNKHCPACHRKLSKEVGFYYGGMYVNYALSITFSLLMYGLIYLIAPGLEFMWTFLLIIVATVLCVPLLYGLSKIIWANLFFDYQGPASSAPVVPGATGQAK